MANVVDLIKADHRKVEELFAKFESGEDTSEALVAEIVKELHVHAEAEESIVYPLMDNKDPEAEELEDHAQREHDEIKEALSHVEAAANKAEHVAKLKEVVTHHVQEEEAEFLPAFQERYPDRHDIAAEWEEFKLNHPSH